MSFLDIFTMVMNFYSGGICLFKVVPGRSSVLWALVWVVIGVFAISNGLRIAGV